MIGPERNQILTLTHLTRYEIEARLDREALTLSGEAHILYTNNEDVPLEEIYLRLFPNTPAYGGQMEVSGLTVDGQVPPLRRELDGSALVIELAQPLVPAQQIELTMAFAVQVPADNEAGYGAFNYQEGILALPNFSPLVPVYDDEGWNVEVAPDLGDAVFSDVAFYTLSLTVPQQLTVVASGSTVQTRFNDDGTKTLLIVSGPVRDFNLVMSEAYQLERATVGETTVNSYYLTKDEEAGKEALGFARQALETFNRRFGPYPYVELDLVETPTTAGGIEYPGLIAIGIRHYQAQDQFFEFAVAHEVAHQWWYGLVGNDQVDEPWLDEALANYSTLLYYEAAYGQPTASEVKRQALELPYEEVVEKNQDEAANQPVSAYTDENYYAVVYAKGALFFDALRQTVGDETFFSILQSYLQENRYSIAYPDDLLRAAETVSGRDLDELYTEWILSPGSPTPSQP